LQIGGLRLKAGPDALRILVVSETWQGSNGYAFVRAFRRAGHSVSVIADEWYSASGWRSVPLRVLRRLVDPLVMRDFTAAIDREARQMRPHLLFVFNGFMVRPEALRGAQDLGAIAINFWPDVSIMAHGRHIPQALPVYDWVFTTKTFGIGDMERQLGVTSASFMPHAFDPETHMPMQLDADDRARYAADASFIGTWSPKKEAMLYTLQLELPEVDLKIWGAQWERATAAFKPGTITGEYALGAEYAKAITASKINIAILSEVRAGSSSGDQITSRTFHIPACGGFMLHERTDEVKAYFVEGQECAMFSDASEMVEKVRYYLARDSERRVIADAGRQRCLDAGYSFDHRAADVIAKLRQLMVGNPAAGPAGHLGADAGKRGPAPEDTT
jgi:spore maturation protein CgeB